MPPLPPALLGGAREGEAGESVWEALLRESTGRAKLPPSTVLVVGSPGSGKSQLLSKFCSPFEQEKETYARAETEILAYDFFEAVPLVDRERRGARHDPTAPLVSVWSMSDAVFLDVMDMALNDRTVDNAAVIIVVDMSKPDAAMASALRWLAVVERRVQALVQKMPGGRKAALRERVAAAARRSGGDTADFHFDLPLLVVGSKADALVTGDLASMEYVQSIVAELRCLCHLRGAGFVLTSATRGGNIPELHALLLSALYPDAMPEPPALKGGPSDALAAPGADTPELIAAAAGQALNVESALEGLRETVSTAVQTARATAQAPAAAESKEGDAAVEEAKQLCAEDFLEDEQAWLLSLKHFMESSWQRSGTTAGASGSPAQAVKAMQLSQEGSVDGADSKMGDSQPVYPKEVVRQFFRSLLGDEGGPK